MAPFLIPLVSSLAPALVRLATGSDRAAEVAESVSGAVQHITGVAPDTPEQAEEARRLIEADPDLHARLAAELRAVEQRELEVLLLDRQSARARDLELRRLGDDANARANIMLLMAFLAVIAIAGVLVLLNLGSGEQDGRDLQFTGAIIGFLTGVGGMFARNIGSAFDFEFGSSRGSKAKDGQIGRLARELGAPRAADPAAAQARAGGAAGRAAGSALDAFRRRLES